MVTVVGSDGGRQPLTKLRPPRHVVLLGQGRRVETQLLEQFRMELRLDRPDRDVSSVRALVGVVVRGTGVEHVGAALSLHMPLARNAHIIWARTPAPSTIAASMTCPLPERSCSHNAESTLTNRNMEPPPKSPTRLSGGTGFHWRGRRRAGCRSGDVVDVVARLQAARSRLPPPRHPRVMRRSLTLAQSSGPSPSRSVTPGRKPSINTSALAMRPSTVSRSPGSLRLAATERLFRRR